MPADHWTQVDADGQPSAHFEHTMAMTEIGPVVLTAGPNGESLVAAAASRHCVVTEL